MCEHLHTIGDNYGRTCKDCGKVLAGYGYFAEGSKVCLHQIVESPEGERYCLYCEIDGNLTDHEFQSEFAAVLLQAHPKLATALSSAIARGISKEDILSVVRRVNSVPMRTLAESFVEEQFKNQQKYLAPEG